MTEEDSVANRLLLQRIDQLSSDLRDMRTAQIELNKQGREDSLKIERLLAEVRGIGQVSESVKGIELTVDKHEIRLSLIEEGIRVDNQKKLPERLEKLEAMQMKLIGGLAVLAVMWALGQTLMKVFLS